MNPWTNSRSAAVLFGVFALAGCHKSQVMIGVATDFPAPTALQSVRLEVERDGVLVIQNDWEITGVPAMVYNLPGSFNVFADDGSTPRIKTRVLAYAPGADLQHPLVVRESLFSLLLDRALFTRMTLVKKCQEMNAGGTMDCPSGQTCVEGYCKSPEIDSRRFPAYSRKSDADDPANLMACDSGSTLINTSDGSPMPVLGQCADDEYCSEGTCLKTNIPGEGDAGAGDGQMLTGCTLLDQNTPMTSGCTPDQKCDFDKQMSLTTGVIGQCVANPGPGFGVGAACGTTGVDDCARGLECLDGACHTMCDGDGDCDTMVPSSAGDAKCVLSLGLIASGIPKVCSISCDPFGAMTGCAAGFNCRVMPKESSFVTDCRPSPGIPILEGNACNPADDQCAAGLVCVGVDTGDMASSRCVKLCRVLMGNGDCTGGKTCSALNINGAMPSTKYGGCL